MSFEDIKIVGLDDEKTRPSDKASGLRHMFLRLSESPKSEWIEFFNNQRSFPRHNMWRDAWIAGGYIVVDCVPEEIGRYHLPDLKTDVSNANIKYREYLQEVEAEEEHRRELEQAEKDRLKKVKDGLDFD